MICEWIGLPNAYLKKGQGHMIKIHFIVVKLNDYTVYHSKIELNLLGNASRRNKTNKNPF